MGQSKLYLAFAILNALLNTDFKGNKKYVIFLTEMTNKKFAISSKIFDYFLKFTIF